MYEINGICYAGEPRYVPKACGVRALEGHLLWVRYNNGQQRVYDMKPHLDGPVFRPLKDPEVFRDVYIDYNAPTWLDGAVDIDPDTIYEKGINPEEQ
jgi:hypothetical protein